MSGIAQRPRPYATRARRFPVAKEAQPAPSGDSSIANFRPLLSAATANGIMTIGVLQFLGGVWSTMPPLAREYLTMALQGAFLGFLFQMSALVVAMVVQNTAGRYLRRVLNFYGVAVIIMSVFVTGQLVARALKIAQPPTAPLPPDAYLRFLALGVIGLTSIALISVLSEIVRIVRRFLGSRRGQRQ